MEQGKEKRNRKGGRKPKLDPAVHRYSISLTDSENAKFLSLFEQSGLKVMAHFITACIFQKPIKTVKIDKASMDFHIQLTQLYAQFRGIGINYNQIVKLMHQNFSEKKAQISLQSLEKRTVELSLVCKEIIELIKEFEKKHLENSLKK